MGMKMKSKSDNHKKQFKNLKTQPDWLRNHSHVLKITFKKIQVQVLEFIFSS